MLDTNNSALVIIDVQERLVGALCRDTIVQKTSILASAAKILGIPTIVTEQYPKGLGHTLETVKEKLVDNTPIIEKTAFSAMAEDEFMKKLKALNKKQVVICGIEAHVCVYQSASDLVFGGWEVYVAKDACASRCDFEFEMGMERIKDSGAKLTCVEIVLFEWLKTAKNPNFKEIQALIK